jgi:hypothetical protein
MDPHLAVEVTSRVDPRHRSLTSALHRHLGTREFPELRWEWAVQLRALAIDKTSGQPAGRNAHVKTILTPLVSLLGELERRGTQFARDRPGDPQHEPRLAGLGVE